MKIPWQIENGSTVEIEIDDLNYTATVTDSTGAEIGKIEFYYIEGVHAHQDGHLKLYRAFLEGMGGKYQGHGIGTKCVELMKDATGLNICVSPDDGRTREDGSHLTGVGPIFADKLKRLGLAFEC